MIILLWYCHLWLDLSMHVSLISLRRYLIYTQSKTAKRRRVEDSKYACTDLQEHGRSLHRGLKNGSLPAGSRGRDPVGFGTTHKSRAKPQKKNKINVGYTRNLRGGHWAWGDRRGSAGMGVYPIPSWLRSLGSVVRSFSSGVWGGAAALNDFWFTQFCVI